MQKRIVGIALCAMLFAICFSVEAQQAEKIPRVGILGSVSASGSASRIEALRAGLRDLGYVEGKNIVFEFRWAETNYDRLPELAAELARLNVDVLVTHGVPGSLAAKRATTTIPIVITNVGDAVAVGLIASLARPGGNITGISFFNPELSAKRLELLKEIVPRTRQVAVLLNPKNPIKALILQAMEITARSMKMELQKFELRGSNDLECLFSDDQKSRRCCHSHRRSTA